ncbi:MAG: hypothetical protein HY078_12055 [Elusimicrobia bacterium]|nr:hypothetical protein [Elusimicrobiota bacterium]
MKIHWAAWGILALAACPLQAREWAGSQFTSIDERVCKHPRQPDGTDTRMDCPGAGGYTLQFSGESGYRSVTVVAPDGKETTIVLHIPGFDIELGSPKIEMIHVEWLTEAKGGTKVPYSFILPIDAVERQAGIREHHFVVVQLSPATCLVEIVPVLSIDSVIDRYWTAQGVADAVHECRQGVPH